MKVRLVKRIINLLSSGPMSTADILKAINASTKFGTDVKELGNILGKDRRVFEKDNEGGQTMWKLKQGFKRHL